MTARAPSPAAELPTLSAAQVRWARLREEFAPKPRRTLGDVALQTVRDLRRMRGQRVQGTSTFQSINYSFVDNAPQREHIRRLTEQDAIKQHRQEFLLIMLVGLTAGLVTVVLVKTISLILSRHTKLVMGLWKESPVVAWLVLTIPRALLFVASASIVLYWMPAAAGSGIPEVKAYLNGILLPEAWGPKVFVTKVVSCALACASGMPVGPEGPIIYLGGNVGRFLSRPWMIKRIGLPYTNKLQRTAMTLGVAAGVACAFAAPIGAVLFVVEEVASIFTTSMLWLGFLCSFTSYFVTLLCNYFSSGSGFHTEGIFYAGKIQQWQLMEIPNFMLLGFIMGAFGAVFNVANVNFVNSTYRKKLIRVNRHRQLLELALVAFVLSSAWFFLPALLPCLKKDSEFPKAESESSPKNQELLEATKGLWCEDPEAEYNPLASLMFGSLEEIVNFLFMPSNGFHPFPGGVLVLYTFLFAISACFIAGSSMATGIFIPMIVIGAGSGRSYAYLLQVVLPYLGDIDPAAYAVCGAAGFVSGVSRISVAITVIMLEISNDLNLLMPIMLTTGIAKFTGDCLTEPYFEMVLHMRHVPFVEPEPSLTFQQLRCYQVMQRPVTCLPVEATVMDVLKVLSDTTHNGFPVVESMDVQRLHGVITRGHLYFILTNLEQFLSSTEDVATMPMSTHLRNHYLATHSTLHGQAIVNGVDPMHLGRTIDLHRWMSRAPVTVHQLNSMEQAFLTFRTFGLRQLLVVSSEYLLVGILTRHDLFHVQHDPEMYQHQAMQHHEDFTRLRLRLRSASSLDNSPTAGAAGGNAQLNGELGSDDEWGAVGVAPALPGLPRRSSSREWGQQLERRIAAPLPDSPAQPGLRRMNSSQEWGQQRLERRIAAPLLDSHPELPEEQASRRASTAHRIRQATSVRRPIQRLRPGQREEDEEVDFQGG